ncbi:hypothetical protein D3C76_1462390 [compost metagenome]
MLTQARRNEKATCAIKLQVHGIADQQSLQAASFLAQGRQLSQLGFDELPFRQGIDSQTGVDGVDRDDELPSTTRHELIAIPAWHRESPLCVETDGVSSAKHGCASPLIGFPCQ